MRRSSSALVVALLCTAAMMESVVASTVERADSSTPSDPSPLIRTISATGWLDIDFNPDVLQAMGLTVTGQSRSHLRLPLLPGADPLQVKLGDGAPTAAGKGGLRVEGLIFHRADGAMTPPLQLGSDGEGLDLSLRDADGREWARIEQVMRSPDVANDGFRYVTANFSAAASLVDFAGAGANRDLLGNVSLQVPMKASASAKSEAIPVWPGTPGTITDVLLIDIPSITTDVPGIATSRCRVLGGGAPCDGPGGSEGEVVITPSARLRNSQHANTTDVPWYRMFSESTSLYPDIGPKVDQHPYLVWNLYRFDPDGSIRQIARSGVKHAFATGNEMCTGYTPYGHVLGPGCSDLYNLTSNDCDRFLGPRSEIIPATGQWGRCGSIQDPDCDGVTEPAIPAGFSCAAAYSSPASDKYSYRLLARETDIDPDLHPDARWFMDAWYVIRDDENIENSMGFRELTLGWQPSFSRWNVVSTGDYAQGAVLDRWLAEAGGSETSYRATFDTPEGHVGVGVRVRRIGAGQFRYDYAVMNFDFARAQTDALTAEPNLRVLGNRGLSGLSVDLLNGAAMASSGFDDGNADAADDWSGAVDSGKWRWDAPGVAGATLDWGQLRFFQITSSSWPGSGSMTLFVADTGMPSSYATTLPVPDGSIGVFGSSFE